MTPNPSSPNPPPESVTQLGLIVCTVLAAQINQSHFLLGRYNTIDDALTDVTVIEHREHLPPAGATVRLALIGTGADKQPGIPLDEFADEHLQKWDGSSPVNLYFQRDGGGFDHWEPAATDASQADQAAIAAGGGGPGTGTGGII